MERSESTAANPDRRSRRRWFQYSLRSFLILLTVFAVWLGVAVNRAREQREAVKAIEAAGGWIGFDWETEYSHSERDGIVFSIDSRNPPGPEWLRRLVGEEFFQDAEIVVLDDVAAEATVLDLIPQLRRLRTLRILSVAPRRLSQAGKRKLRDSLSECEIW